MYACIEFLNWSTFNNKKNWCFNFRGWLNMSVLQRVFPVHVLNSIFYLCTRNLSVFVIVRIKTGLATRKYFLCDLLSEEQDILNWSTLINTKHVSICERRWLNVSVFRTSFPSVVFPFLFDTHELSPYLILFEKRLSWSQGNTSNVRSLPN